MKPRQLLIASLFSFSTYGQGKGKLQIQAEARAKGAKDYLVKVRGINAARIVTINGGCREKLEVELYALPSSTLPPAPNPYRNQ